MSQALSQFPLGAAQVHNQCIIDPSSSFMLNSKDYRMTRKIISLIATSLIVITLGLMLVISVAQVPIAASPPAQGITPTTPRPIALPQPLRINIRQQLPITLTLPTTNTTGAPTQTVTTTLNLNLLFDVTRTLTTTIASSITLRLADQPSVTLPISLTFSDLHTAVVHIIPLRPILSDVATSDITETTTVTATATTTATATLTPTVATATATTTPSVPPTLIPTTAVTPTVSPTIRPAATVTPTVAATITPTVATTVTATSVPTTEIRSTVPVTANLRGGPDISFPLVGEIKAGQTVKVVAQDASGNWYLLDSGQWIANFLVENVPANLPVATDALLASLATPTPITATVAVTTPVAITATIPITTPIASTSPVAVTATQTPSVTLATATPTPTSSNLILVPTMTPTPVATVALVKPTALTNANLRSGPSTEFPILGGTTIGEELTIVARNADNSWLKLNNGGWISTRLVNNPPDAATVPVEQVVPGAAAQ